MRADERRDEGEQQRNVENRNRLPRHLHAGTVKLVDEVHEAALALAGSGGGRFLFGGLRRILCGGIGL